MMTLRSFSMAVALLLGAIVSLPTRAFGAADWKVPVFTVDELKNGKRGKDLSRALKTTGLLSVAVGDETVRQARRDAFQGLCSCMSSEKNKNSLFGFVDGTDSTLLADGTTRTTLATATVGGTPLGLNKEALHEAGCSEETIQAMELLRDQVAWASHNFVVALDRLLGDDILLETDTGAPFPTVKSIVKASQNLEHFHLYEKSSSSSPSAEESAVLDVHTDAGLFLAFVPGMHCSSAGAEKEDTSSDFYLQNEGTLLQKVQFEPGTIGIMLGLGAERWLKTDVPLRATRHSVRMENGQSRAWYGMMHLVPRDAVISDFPKRTFADMRKAMALTGNKAREYGDARQDNEVDTQGIAIGCGASTIDLVSGEARINRRRLHSAPDASVCNNVTNFFCWMSCLEIPEADNAIGYIREGYSLYCLEPAELARTGNRVSAATDKCNLGDQIGGGFNEACMGSWQPTAPGVPGYPVKVDEELLTTPDEAFCYGGTTMFMDGFKWTDSTCVIYLFPSWVLNSVGAVIGACFGTIAFAIALEVVIWKRRSVVSSIAPGWKRKATSAIFYGLQLTMGYFLMLVIMTYSGPLFLCVVLGLMSGHVLFNAGGGSKKKTRTNTEEEDQEAAKENNEHACCGSNETGSEDDSRPFVPEGSTPCCQNVL